MAQRRSDILICGGSYVGLTLALSLVRTLGSDLRVAVIDRSAFETAGADDVRASALAAGSRHLLDAIGLWARLRDAAQPVMRIELTDSSLDAGVRPIRAHYDNVLDDGAAASVILPNAELHRVLLDAVRAEPGIELIGGQAVRGFSAGPAGAEVELADGETRHASLVVAADGRMSALREAAGIKLITWDYDQLGIVTRVAHERPHGGTAVQHFLPGGPFAILPLTGNRCCITWSERTAEARRVLALDDAAFLDELDLRVAGRLGRLTLDGARQSWPLGMHLARRYVAPRLALVGDAAHGVHPIAGQGLNLAFRDIAALTEVLAVNAFVGLDLGDFTALERYERWRRFDSMVSAATFDALNRLFSNDAALVRSVRELGLGMVDRLPVLKTMLVREAAGLSGDVPRLLRGVLPAPA